MRSELFWDFTQRRIVVSYRSCEAAYRFYLQGNEKFGTFVVAYARGKIPPPLPPAESQSWLNVGPSALKKRETM